MGMIGTTFVFDTLINQLEEDAIVLDIILNDAYPSFGYFLTQNATTLWESWEGTSTVWHGSRNHIMFGAGIGTLYYEHFLGITSVTNGFQEIKVQPLPSAIMQIQHVNGSIISRFGMINVLWKYNAKLKQFHIQFHLPHGIEYASIHIPYLNNATSPSILDNFTKEIFWENNKLIPKIVDGIVSGKINKRNWSSGVKMDVVFDIKNQPGMYDWVVSY